MKRAPLLLLVVALLGSCSTKKKVDFILLGPASGSTFVSLTPTLSWKDAKDDNGYTVEIDDEQFFLDPFVHSATVGRDVTSYDVPAGVLLPSTTYYWRVNVKSGGFPVVAENSPFTFTTAGWGSQFVGANDDTLLSAAPTTDGGCILAGITSSFGAAGQDGWVVRMRKNGTIEWQKRFSGAAWEQIDAVIQTADGGFAFAGQSGSFGAGNADIWLVKLTSSGAISWQKAYGTANGESARDLRQTTDGGFVIAGQSSTANGEAIFLKVDSVGAIQVQKMFGTGNATQIIPFNGIQTNDGNYVIAGRTDFLGKQDIFAVKIDSTGAIVWQKAYGGNVSQDMTRGSLVQATDGSYVMTGGTASFGAGDSDLWVLKLAADGSITMQKTFGGAGFDQAGTIQQTFDGGFIVGGGTLSFGAAAGDIWALKLTSAGTISWQKRYGGVNEEALGILRQAADGGFFACGVTDPTAGNLVYEWLALKTESDGRMAFTAASGFAATDTNGISTDTAVAPADLNFTTPAIAMTAADATSTAADTTATISELAQ